MNIAIIGGGASGIMCAIHSKHNITIFTKEEKLGKKILLTGNGRCNLSNKNFSKDSYNIDISSYLSKFNTQQTLQYFLSLGLLTYSDTSGRVYPISNTATSVVDVLCSCVEKKAITVQTNYEVKDIKKVGDKFLIDNKFTFDKVVIATGSCSNLLDSLGVEYSPFVPSLVALKTKQNTKRLSGLKLSNVKVILKDKVEFGEVLFKDNGLSGICIFNISSYLAREKNYKQKIQIDILPEFSKQNLQDIFQKRLKNNYQNYIQFMQGIFHKEINKYILKNCEINEEKIPNSKDNEKIINCIKSLQFDIVNTYENNQINCGGINLCDLDENLMHKQIKNLYFVGEVCDVDGLCGGYNLQWAWTSGKIVGENL